MSVDVGQLSFFRDPDRPRVVCLCGSTRFRREFEWENARLTMEGWIVLSVGFFMHADRRNITNEEKEALDKLHLRKIDLADEVFVINPVTTLCSVCLKPVEACQPDCTGRDKNKEVQRGSYIGDSTRREIEHAKGRGKPIRSIEPL